MTKRRFQVAFMFLMIMTNAHCEEKEEDLVKSLFGIKDFSQFTKPAEKVSTYMHDVYDFLSQSDGNGANSVTVKGIKGANIREESSGDRVHLKFELKDDVLDINSSMAFSHLVLTRRQEKHFVSKALEFPLMLQVETQAESRQVEIPKDFSRKEVEINITSTLSDSISKQENATSVFLSFSSVSGQPLANATSIFEQIFHSKDEDLPLVVIFDELGEKMQIPGSFAVNSRYRRRRSLGATSTLLNGRSAPRLHLSNRDALKENKCRLHRWVFNLDFAFIVAPKSAEINYCSGVCPRPMTHQDINTYNATRNAFLRSLLHGHTEIETASCVPLYYSSLTVLYQKDEQMVVKRFPMMKADGCGCR